MAKGTVRTHTRRTKNGSTTTVRQHNRQGQGRTLVSAGHAWQMARTAWRMRRRRRAVAAILGGLAVAELGIWLTLRGTSLLLSTAGLLAIGVASIAAAASGGGEL